MLLMFVLLFLIAIFAGFFGALVGIGGGIIIVPALTLFYNMPIHSAVAVSLVSVVATSIGGSRNYVDREITNIRLSMFLEIFTVAGAVLGAFIGLALKAESLKVIFGLLILYVALTNFFNRNKDYRLESFENVKLSKIEEFLRQQGEYYDEAEKKLIRYIPRRPILGGVISALAGFASGLLGIGGGVFKVAAMTSLMRMPMKAAIACSKFMIGITASASAIVYFIAGKTNVFISAPIVLGVLVGSTFGSIAMNKIKTYYIKVGFSFVAFYLAFKMLEKFISNIF